MLWNTIKVSNLLYKFACLTVCKVNILSECQNCNGKSCKWIVRSSHGVAILKIGIIYDYNGELLDF